MTDHDKLSDWAENDMTLPENSTTALRGDAAAAAGRNLLEQTMSLPETVCKRIHPTVEQRTAFGDHIRELCQLMGIENPDRITSLTLDTHGLTVLTHYDSKPGTVTQIRTAGPVIFR